MEITTLCAIVASLRVLPSRSQFFQYESLSLSCEQLGNSSQWRVKRNTSTEISGVCSISWNKRYECNCSTDDAYTGDTGVYWCESEAGERSNAVSITVTAGSVILESPVLPVMEGDTVTLRCLYKETISSSSSDLTADFYKDGFLMATSSTGNTTIHAVSKSDEGLYKCNISGVGGSPDSWLSVRAGCPDAPRYPLGRILLPVVVACLSLAALTLLCIWSSHKGEIDPTVVMFTHVPSTGNRRGAAPRSRSFLLYSVAVYRPDSGRRSCTSNHELTYKA